MIYITQLIYLHMGQEKVFDEFEAIALPAIQKYNGRLLLRIRPSKTTFIEAHIEEPYEIHLVEFNSKEDLTNFTHDEERKKFLHLKQKSVKSAILIQGQKI